ncbi:MAG: phage tail protein, partial [Xylophilus sp.]|nr:phage tail protein [Xylophilus sp.]
MTRHILPPQCTELERAVDESMPSWDGMADAIEPAKMRVDPQFQPWLAMQWQVAMFAPYFPSVDALLTASLPWLLERGTAASVVRALGWVGFAGSKVDEDGAYLHINLGRPATAEEMARVAHVVRASLPAHVHFYRVFNPLNDVRRIVLDRAPPLDTGMLDGDSGVMGPDGVKLSFGERSGATLPAAPADALPAISTHQRVGLIRYDDMPVLDAWRLDSHVLMGVSGGVMELFRSTTTAHTPGGGALATAEARASVAPWVAAESVATGAAAHLSTAPEPISPPRRW